ncbi:uncharacterized protein EI90DRAFT_2609098 [Cantharellus anzutake]|uniref:uncharacterized protein n=1 Tax=Cantharellus anzutake TaxID=1750568 RepID=UPI001906A32C|nr:uncharacterized protein EI90DRAFT_2609098 [Cantharellus anzutake]KAF8320634.1 hypothetical protein EI90DRAFT_2609098 [Cantharellus anzutake]
MASILPFLLLIYSLKQTYKKYRSRNSTSASKVEPGLQPISVLFLCSVFGDMICGLGHALSIRWVLAGEITEGPYCTVQAVFMQIGSNGTAWFTMAIAVLTYLQVVHPTLLGKSGAKIFAAGCVCFTTVFTLLIIAIPASIDRSYYGNSG